MREAQENRAVALADISTKAAIIETRRSDIAVREADANYAGLQYRRSRALVPQGAVSEQEAQMDSARMMSTRAQVVGARSDLAGAQADFAGSRAQAQQADAAIAAALAEADRIRSEIKDAVLVAPIRGRIDSRLAEQGEVVPAGGRVYSMLDLSDVYMYVFLPNEAAGKIRVGSEARIVLDAAPDNPITAMVSFVSPQAQFTPKTVETAEERHNLTFRVKLQIPRERLRQYESLVKSGVPGMGYVKFDSSVQWPAYLQSQGVPSRL
jgi:HlyD family secretion protein